MLNIIVPDLELSVNRSVTWADWDTRILLTTYPLFALGRPDNLTKNAKRQKLWVRLRTRKEKSFCCAATGKMFCINKSLTVFDQVSLKMLTILWLGVDSGFPLCHSVFTFSQIKLIRSPRA